MNQQPDKLFREKLHGYQQPASSGAWNRISENLGRKNRRAFWLRMAATVLLLVTSGVFIYPALWKNATDPVAHHKALPKNQETLDVKTDTARQSPIHAIGETAADASHKAVTENIHPGKSVAQRHGRTQNGEKKIRTLPKDQYAHTEPAKSPLPETGNQNSVTSNEVMASRDAEERTRQVFGQQPLKTESTAKARNIKIVFTAEEVNEKYLAKISDAKATREAKETSGLKRLLDKAHDLKNNQDPLGDLRQRKNEILAMNFKNEKEHIEND